MFELAAKFTEKCEHSCDMVGCLLRPYYSHSNILLCSAASQIQHEMGEEEEAEEITLTNQKRNGIFSGMFHWQPTASEYLSLFNPPKQSN